jgi:two-component system sensor histidine kinase/response regulator
VEIHRRHRDGAAVAFDVIDTGPGIRPDDQARLFEAFEQARQDTIGAFEGTGLGLYVSQRLASQLGGLISFTSRFGKGSVFTLTLPTRPGEVGSPA